MMQPINSQQTYQDLIHHKQQAIQLCPRPILQMAHNHNNKDLSSIHVYILVALIFLQIYMAFSMFS